jgi:hypothetical protein
MPAVRRGADVDAGQQHGTTTPGASHPLGLNGRPRLTNKAGEAEGAGDRRPIRCDLGGVAPHAAGGRTGTGPGFEMGDDVHLSSSMWDQPSPVTTNESVLAGASWPETLRNQSEPPSSAGEPKWVR